jgi:ribosomal protein L33
LFVTTKGVELADSGMRTLPEKHIAYLTTDKNPSQHIHRTEVEKHCPRVAEETPTLGTLRHSA